MGAAVVNIINPDGTVIALGGKTGDEDYTKCFIASGEYSDEYQGASQVNLTVHTNRNLPVAIGARIFYDEPDGAGGYVMLSPPSIERISSRHFIYEMIFSGNIHLLETKLFFNQDMKGAGWNLSFSLVGKAEDFLDLICTNMNRTQPVTDPISETWEVGTVDDTTSELLIDFDNDNCLTALRKISEAFNLPYRTSLDGDTITLDLTNECRVHDHTYSIGEGLMKFKMAGDSDRPFATALHVLGGMQNIPYDYQSGLRRLRMASDVPDEEEIMFDDGASTGTWQASKGNTVSGVSVSFVSTDAVYHGTKAMKIYPTSGGSITGQIINLTNVGDPYEASGGTLHFYLYLEPGALPMFITSYIKIAIIDNGTEKYFELRPGMYGYSASIVGSWQHIVIPLSDFGLTTYLVEGANLTLTGYWPDGAKLHMDYFYIAMHNTVTNSFLFDEDDVDQHGRIEAVAVNDDIYPKSSLSVQSKTSQLKFVSNLDFDLNEKDLDGNTIYLIAGIDARLTFNSGNLSGYSFAIKSYTTLTNEIELVPFTEDSGQQIPDTGTDPQCAAYQFDVGDTFVITEINMPESYVEEAETDLLEWGQGQYLDYSAHNEIADVEIDPVWVRQASDLQYVLFGESPVVHYDLDPLVDLFKAGDLITINIEGLFARQLRVVQVTHEFYSKNAVWKLTLGNYKPVNLAGQLVGRQAYHQYMIDTTNRNLKLVKYFAG